MIALWVCAPRYPGTQRKSTQTKREEATKSQLPLSKDTGTLLPVKSLDLTPGGQIHTRRVRTAHEGLRATPLSAASNH